MTYSLPIPLQDELALGLLGRFARINGLTSTQWAVRSLQARHPEGKNAPLLWQMAAAFGRSDVDFSSHHSMLSVLFPISAYKGSEREVARSRHVAHSRGMDIPTHQPRWCPHCAALDMERRGFGHWRRQHHIAGVDWCVDHHIPLICAPLGSTLHAPGQPATQGTLAAPAETLEKESGHPALIRIQRIMAGWLHRPQPVSLAAWTKVVGERCRSAGLRIGEVGKRPVVSDRIREEFPVSWLTRHMPEICLKEAQSFVRKVDGACIDKHVAYPALACASILAVLFECADQALDALEQADQEHATARQSTNSSGEALTAFLAGVGLHEACEKFGASVAGLEAALRQQLRRHVGVADTQTIAA